MATGSVKVILFIGFGLSAFVAHSQPRPEPIEPEVEVEVRAPMVKAASEDHLPIMVVKGPCNLTNQQAAIAWKNVLEELAEKYPEYLKYCEMTPRPTTKIFMVVNDVCLTRIQCAKNVDGVNILNGDFIVEVDETTQEVGSFIDVPW